MIHTPFGVAADCLTFEFELDDRDRFVHLCHKLGGTGETRVVLKITCLPDSARVITVGLHGKIRQRQEVYAVSLFQGLYIGIADGHTQYRSYQSRVA